MILKQISDGDGCRNTSRILLRNHQEPVRRFSGLKAACCLTVASRPAGGALTLCFSLSVVGTSASLCRGFYFIGVESPRGRSLMVDQWNAGTDGYWSSLCSDELLCDLLLEQRLLVVLRGTTWSFMMSNVCEGNGFIWTLKCFKCHKCWNQ